MNFDNFFMREALKQAELAFSKNEVPVGAVIVDRENQKIIAKSYNNTEEKNNTLYHAEIIAINKACKIISSKNLSNYDIYVTLEPCAMCATAIAHSRLRRLFYGASDSKHGAVESNLRYFNSKACFHRPDIYSGIFAEDSALLMKEFFKKIRD
ncbi:tRNA-specific adenosine deaminase [Rickettsia sp. MEAM1 (Bemisia tabaci)]|uniref:nucleoside deaminase n=1 Tax=unclassified Rickettsia TaxID=114295 RepID=UPI0002D97B08|nr:MULTISPECIES: nucleoside deaminase [unclassified Rickettsia]ASX27855.1 tRNA-specific adenosine deaminase [Rickettsia sp. MEAM1 (Bemisia tabaci)]ODA37167.1 tRNA-specific adenosine deaminase [Rickettsia sp. wq]ODA37213.1 tRNA-specific adenosine deaminase [Rickettsia sp. wb]